MRAKSGFIEANENDGEAAEAVDGGFTVVADWEKAGSRSSGVDVVPVNSDGDEDGGWPTGIAATGW